VRTRNSRAKGRTKQDFEHEFEALTPGQSGEFDRLSNEALRVT
jgi:hypothetical protein